MRPIEPRIGDRRAPRRKRCRGRQRPVSHQAARRFLWKRPAFMMTDRFSPWPVSNSSFLIGSPSTDEDVGERARLHDAELAWHPHDLRADERRLADDLDRRQHLAAQQELAALVHLQLTEEIAAVAHRDAVRACRSRATSSRRRSPARSSRASRASCRIPSRAPSSRSRRRGSRRDRRPCPSSAAADFSSIRLPCSIGAHALAHGAGDRVRRVRMGLRVAAERCGLLDGGADFLRARTAGCRADHTGSRRRPTP